MLIDLAGKVALVTGAGRGIGADLARTLAAEGAVVVALDVDQNGLDALAAELAADDQILEPYVCDVRDLTRIKEVVAAVTERHGRIDVLVNNAGVSTPGPVEELSEESWDFAHDVNLKGTFLMTKAVIPVMKAQRSGRIINAASFAAIVPVAGRAAYASSKAAVAHLTRVLAGELGPWGITVNAYAPGMIPTELNHFDELPVSQQDRLLSTLTLRRWGSTDDIGNLLCFLASDLASYITGTLIDVSGGKLATQFPRAAYEAAEASGDYSFAEESR